MPKALVGLIGLLGCAGAVAYASAPPEAADRPKQRQAGAPQLPMPWITQYPDEVSTSSKAGFDFAARRRIVRFQCRLDRRRWKACRAPIVFTRLDPGRHAFAVRGRDARGRRSAAARFRWRVLEPRDFSIEPQLGGLSPLYPGAPPEPLPVRIANPHPAPIFVTSLRVAATADPSGCTSAENLTLTQSSASSAAPLRVPAGGAVTLPAQGVSPPAIQLRDLPVNQDACQNARFPLSFSGKARG